MKCFAVFFSVIISFAACSTRPANSTANSIADNSNTNSFIASNANSKMIPLEGVDPNQFNSNSSNAQVANRTTSKEEPTFGPRSAPDNSEVNTVMRPDGSVAETRTFKDHAELVKVERVTNGPKVTVKVYLKNGRVIDVPKEKVPEFHVIAPGNILLAAGIQTAGSQPKVAGKKTEPENETEEIPK